MGLASAGSQDIGANECGLLNPTQYSKQESLVGHTWERILFTQICAHQVRMGDIGVRVLQLDEEQLKGLKTSLSCVGNLTQKSRIFDIRFSVLKGKGVDTAASEKGRLPHPRSCRERWG
jgi:hypothetical protein